MSKAAVDWAKLGWCMTQKVAVGTTEVSMFANGRARFGAFKAASDAIAGAHSSASNRAKTVDFAAYRAALPAQAALVDSFEQQFNATVIPKPADKLSASVNADDEVFAKVAADSVAALEKTTVEASKELNVLKALPPAYQMTDADVYAFMPELNPFTEEIMAENDYSVAGGGGVEALAQDQEREKKVRAGLKKDFFPVE